jgi:S-adenosylmethionine:tRNA ribosyltransferase-isomerase
VTPASWPRSEPLDEKLLVVERASKGWHDGRVRDLPGWLRRGDVVVVNDAATVPASFFATGPDGTGRRAPLEVRLAAHVADERWRAVLFGDGDWRTRTEDRPPPPRLHPGDVVMVVEDATLRDRATERREGGLPDLHLRIEAVDPCSPRLVVARFTLRGARLWSALYGYGRPVQYRHISAPLDLWHAQTPFAARPWSVEMPSAGRPLAWSLLAGLRAQGVGVVALTHAAGLSSTGDPAIDAALPLPERFDIPAATVRAIVAGRAAGGRVVAVGTTVVRALEGCAALHGGELVPGEGTTDLRLGPGSALRAVDGLLTGMHDVGTSHRELLRAFAPEPLLAAAWSHAEARGYLGHEFGDLCLIV